MNLTVEWVEKGTRFRPAVAYRDEHVPVIRIATLRAWLVEQRDIADAYQKLEARTMLNRLLAQLPEDPGGAKRF